MRDASPLPSRVRVRYAETDKMGVVYYANYFVWFEVGRTDLLREAGWSYREMEAEGFALPVIEAHCAYRESGALRRRPRGADDGRAALAGSRAVHLRGRAGRGRRHAGHRHDGARDARSRRPAVPAARPRPDVVFMKALVTGVAGFIGSTLAERLLADGADVVGIDCFTDYYPRAIKERNLAARCAHPRFRFVESRIQDVDLPALLADRTHVFHLAAQAGVRKSWGRDFAIYTVNNIEATQVLLEAACGMPTLERFVYSSSSSVYGDHVAMPMREDALPQPVSPYGVSKLAAEQLCYLYFANYGVPTVSLRYFTVYGPRQRPDMGFHKFLRATIRGEPITRLSATASRRATSRSSRTRSAPTSPPRRGAFRAACTILEAGRASRSTRCSR